jgi:hypothetical protein
MKKTLLLFLFLSSSGMAADRIDSMSRLEQCVYRARLAAAGAYVRESHTATSCQDIKILWHGDETQNELDYVKKWSCVGFQSGKDPIVTGDAVFNTCSKEADI